MNKVEKFKDLKCWQNARDLAKSVFLIGIDNLKDWSLQSQLRRAALSTMNNIAEGFARFSRKDFIKFLDYSQSSSSEEKSMLYLLEDLKYLGQDELDELHLKVDNRRKLTLGLIKYLKSN